MYGFQAFSFLYFCAIVASSMAVQMKKNVLRTLRSIVLFFVKALALILFCAVFAFAFVYPLWLFAVKRPNVFSACVLILCALFIAAALIFNRRPRGKQ